MPDKLAELRALDAQLVDALFMPAVRAGAFSPSSLRWRQDDDKRHADVFHEQLLPLSEFYATVNAPLSAAIWGIANTFNYMRQHRPILKVITESKSMDERLFVGLQALVATAALQFAHGTADTVITSTAPNNMELYRKHVEIAIAHLSKVGPQNVGE